MRWKRPRPGTADYEAWRRDYFTGAGSGILERMNVQLEVEGVFPEQGGVLVTNHLGYLDVLVLASLGPTVFVSRADVQHWPLIGRLTRWCSTIYIDRTKREQIPAVIGEMKSALATGAQVVFFPEGTSGSGEEVMPFRASLFDVAADGDAPVRVAALSYRTPAEEPPARDSVCWWGDAGFPRHFFVLAGLTQVTASVNFPGAVFRSGDRKELAQRCHAAVTEAFVPVTGSQGTGS
jgi:1-acyl-sn-glycerol-3-phosphate acyltransferase